MIRRAVLQPDASSGAQATALKERKLPLLSCLLSTHPPTHPPRVISIVAVKRSTEDCMDGHVGKVAEGCGERQAHRPFPARVVADDSWFLNVLDALTRKLASWTSGQWPRALDSSPLKAQNM